MKQFRVPYAYLNKTPEVGIANITAETPEEATMILSMVRTKATIGEPWEDTEGKEMNVSEIVHETLFKVKEEREKHRPHTFSYLLATDVMKELAELELRVFNQEMNASVEGE